MPVDMQQACAGNHLGLDVAGMLGTDPRVDLISFTGSTEVGKLLMRRGADSMKRMFLELGGKSVAIVLDDANPAVIVPSAVGVCVHAGQACAATTRMLVHRSLYDQAVADITAAYSLVPVGDPVRDDVLVGPVISAAQKGRVLGAIDEARAAGAEITTGGGPVENLPDDLAGGHFVAPTVVVGVDNSAAIAQREVFGPVLTVIPFDDDDDAVRIANDSPYGLAGAVMSDDLQRCERVARKLRAGIIWVNCSQPTFTQLPWGGVKASGIGRELGRAGFEAYFETKQILPRHKKMVWVLGDAETGQAAAIPTSKAPKSDSPPNEIEPLINPQAAPPEKAEPPHPEGETE